MVNKNNYETNHTTSESFETKDYQNTKNVLSKFDFDLYDESKDLVETVVRVRRVQMPNKGEKWKIFENNKVVFTVEGSKLSKKEKEFLRSSDGFNFLIFKFKEGIKSFSKLKTELKKNIKSK